MLVAPSKKVTVPVAVEGVTVAVNVTFCPKIEGLSDELTVVLVASWLTVCVTLALLHAYVAVHGSLDLTLAQLDDKSKRDLQPEAALRLANIFADLAEAEVRADLMDAIRSRPAAMSYLKVFLGKAEADRAHPLRYLGSYLSDQLKLSAVASN